MTDYMNYAADLARQQAGVLCRNDDPMSSVVAAEEAVKSGRIQSHAEQARSSTARIPSVTLAARLTATFAPKHSLSHSVAGGNCAGGRVTIQSRNLVGRTDHD